MTGGIRVLPIALCALLLAVAATSVFAFKYRTPEKKDSLVLKAKTLLAHEDIEQALQEFRKLTKLEPKNFEGYLGIANCLYYQGDYSKAMDAANTALSLNPNASDAYRRRAKINEKQHQVDAAIENYSKAISISPNTPIYLSERADAYYKKGDLKMAIADLDKYLTLVKRPNPMIFYTRSIIYTKLGKKAEAEAERKRADSIIYGAF